MLRSEQFRQEGKIKGAYIKSDKFKEMYDYAEGKLNESNTESKEYNKNREPYSILKNNCATFASDVLQIDETVKVSNTIINSPKTIVNAYREKYIKVDYNKNSGTQMEEEPIAPD